MPLVGILGLSAPLWIGSAALLLFCALLVVRFAFGLVRHAKSLGADFKRANSMLKETVDRVGVNLPRSRPRGGEEGDHHG
jgi:hypothetical protein